MKGLLKGLRYISQIFGDDKEPEMVIGLPTDVKHLAHIGMDGPSNAPPNWMNGYKQLDTEGDPGKKDSEPKFTNGNSFHKASEGAIKRGSKPHSSAVPKPSRRHSSSTADTDSPTKAKSEKHCHSHRALKGSSGRDFLDPSRQLQSDADSKSGMDSPRKRPSMPNKFRRNVKSKDSGGSVKRSKVTTQAPPLSELGSEPQNHSLSSIKSVEEGECQ